MTNYSDILKLSLQETGENPTTWGDVLNILFNKVEDAIAGTVTLNVTTGTDITLTSTNAVVDQAANMTIGLGGTPTADIDVIIPNKSKTYVIDGTSFLGAYTITIKASGGVGVDFTTGKKGLVYCDGTDTHLIGEPNVNAIPSGLIAMWGGTIANIPTGWSLCNGTGSTPDLRGKFIVGANVDNGTIPTTDISGSALTTGGSKDINFTSGSGGDHTHGSVTGSTSLTVSHLPAHTHKIASSENSTTNVTNSNDQLKAFWPFANEDSAYGLRSSASAATLYNTGSAGSGSGHTHSISASGTHTHTVSSTNANLPPYYALAFIQKD